MRITIRLIISMVLVISFVGVVSTYLQVRHEKQNLEREQRRNVAPIAESLTDDLQRLTFPPAAKQGTALVEKIKNQQRIVGVVLYNASGKPESLFHANSNLPYPYKLIQTAFHTSEPVGSFQGQEGHTLFMYVAPFQKNDGTAYAVGIFKNADPAHEKLLSLWKNGLIQILIQVIIIPLVTLLIIRWSLMGLILRATDWIKKIRLGGFEESNFTPPRNLFGPLAKEVAQMATSLSQARASAEEEARLRLQSESRWTPERLKEYVRSKLGDKPLFLISNREPYMHIKKGKQIECIVPPSGLVTALEPVLRACGGTWIAHGQGAADRETVNSDDKIRVPPDEPQYTLRRVWLTKEEENGYYYGFANEGLWPLCHIAHTRPLFRPEDWKHYQAVNEKFAQATLEEIKDTENPWLLIQDYHFMLLPRYIRRKRPDARIALFWHIPWPNPESFGICPWQVDLLHGMLGADILGFHTQFHCNNFLDTVDRVLESRINWEHFTVNRQSHTTLVKPFPISVAFTPPTAPSTPLPTKEALLKELGVKAQYLGVGVDRIDYTKGILERFRAIDRFLEKNPEYIGKFTFAELGAPSRTLIKSYHDLTGEVEAEAQRINWKYQTKDWKPIVLLEKQHSHKDIEPFYKAADLCLVSSLHDGMNLVAKEYVASRTDGDGVLILSRFTGASRELRDALLVNPYDIDQMADAIRFALQMESDERRARMKRMRESVRDNNIYRWGASLITELSQVRHRKTQEAVV